MAGQSVFALPGSRAASFRYAGRRPSQPGQGQLLLDITASGTARKPRTNTPAASGYTTPAAFAQPPTTPHPSALSSALLMSVGPGDTSWGEEESTLYESSFSAGERDYGDSSDYPSTPAPERPTESEPSRSTQITSAISVLQQLTKAKLTALGLLELILDGDGPLSTYRNSLFAVNRTEKFESFLSKIINDDKGGPLMKKWMLPHAVEVVCDEVHREMDAAKPRLRMYAKEVTPQFLESWDLETLMREVETPVWSRVLDAASETKANKRKAEEKKEAAKLGKSDAKPTKPRRNRVMGRLIITAQVIYLRSSVSQQVQIGLGLMAWSTGASKQMIDVLHLSCLSLPYTTIRQVIDAISEHCVQEASRTALGPHALSYDNINLSTSIFVEQGPRTPSKVQSGTFAVIYELYGASREDMLAGPMQARLLKSTPLKISELRPKVESFEKYMHQATVTVSRVLFDYVTSLRHFSSHPKFQYATRRPTPPRKHRTIFHPLRVSTIEEASVEGNLLVHNDIYLTQLGRDVLSLSDLAIPLYANQLTLARVRGTQEVRSEDVDPWEQRFVFQLAPGVFHLIMNLIWALLSVHRGTLSQVGSLTHFFAIMEKTRLGADHPDFHTLLSALMQILEGLILHAWQLEVDEEELENYAATDPTADAIFRVASEILRKYATARTEPKDTNSKAPPTNLPGEELPSPLPGVDTIANNVSLLIRDLLYVTELVKAVESGDWGRIEDILPVIACMFRGAGSNNYSNEILHLLFNISRVWTEKFANIMRDNILVNVAGHEDNWQAIDMNIEHLIRYLKGLFASKGIYSNWERLGNISASVNCLMSIKKTVAVSMEAGYQGKTHKDVDVSELVWRVASKARELNLLTFDPNRTDNASAKPVLDTNAFGYGKFESASLANFNKKMQEFKDGLVGAFEQEVDEVGSCGVLYVPPDNHEEDQEDMDDAVLDDGEIEGDD